MTWKEIADKLELIPLEHEGGLFKSSYRSTELLDGTPIGSAIYFMLTGQGYSHLHQLPTDEIYHFYLGSPVELLELRPDGTSEVITLGPDLLAGHKVQHVVKAGIWQGSRLAPNGDYALLGTTMAPSYTDEGYVHATHVAELLEQYPTHAKEIKNLTGETKYY